MTPEGGRRLDLDEPAPVALPDQWSYADLAAHLGVSPATARKYASDGRLPKPDGRVGGSPWWKPETIRDWQVTRPGRGVGGGRPRKGEGDE